MLLLIYYFLQNQISCDGYKNRNNINCKFKKENKCFLKTTFWYELLFIKIIVMKIDVIFLRYRKVDEDRYDVSQHVLFLLLLLKS